MTFEDSKTEVFNILKLNLRDYAETLSVEKDSDDTYYLNTLRFAKNKKPHFFGAVQIKKNYVSYHLMPIYINPSLLESVSDNLKKRMQGKSCFNFKEVDVHLFSELKTLTKECYAFYEKEDYI